MSWLHTATLPVLREYAFLPPLGGSSKACAIRGCRSMPLHQSWGASGDVCSYDGSK